MCNSATTPVAIAFRWQDTPLSTQTESSVMTNELAPQVKQLPGCLNAQVCVTMFTRALDPSGLRLPCSPTFEIASIGYLLITV
jgi:hypothetical protein